MSLMVPIAVSKMGVTGLIFVDLGAKVNGQYYRDVLLSQQMLPAIKSVCRRRHVHLTIGQCPWDYSAAATRDTRLHRSWLWPLNSPDLNQVDYKIWGVMQQRVYEGRINNVDELKQRLTDVWSGLHQNIVDTAVSEWRKRLWARVRAQGRHFEHLL